MEGLWGTAIRLAVRDPGSPQAPLFARARRHPARLRGGSCRRLRTRPPSPWQRRAARISPGVSRMCPPGRAGAGTRVSSGGIRSPGVPNGFPAPARALPA